MELRCSHCDREIEYSGDRPKFCSHCGGALLDEDSRDAETLAPSPYPPNAELTTEMVERVGEFLLIRELGRGGMGVVYEAEDEATGRHVALKLLPPSFHRTDETVERFLREGRIAASLSHPRSTFVYSAGEDDGQFFIVMELMPGGTLADVVDQQGPLPINKAVDYILDVIDGLEAAHASGVIHRDVKPSNCFVDFDGRVKVGDYGISKTLISDAALTRTGAFMGTPQFASPEQFKAGQIDSRTDIYAVGATLFHLLAGRAPFEGDAVQVVADIVSEPAPLLRTLRADAGKELELTVARTLEKDPARRPADLAQLRMALLPFSSRGASVGDLGRRLAAYFLDMTLVSVIARYITGLALVSVLARSPSALQDVANNPWLAVALTLPSLAIVVTYFVVTEGRWGRGVGKWLMGLRVVRAGGDSPGLVAMLVRTGFIPVLPWIVASVLPVAVGAASQVSFVNPEDQDGVTRVWPLVSSQLYVVFGWIVSLVCVSTVRAASGYRGIHDFASGTRVVRFRRQSETKKLRLPVTLPTIVEGGSQTFGPYRVTGQLSGNNTVKLFHAVDEALQRPVWVFVTEGSVPAPKPERTALTRPTRLRWLQGGSCNGGRWNAFEVLRGAPLSSLFGQHEGLPWRHARSLLLDLAEELAAAVDDATLPQPLGVEQIWVARGERVKVMDIPIDSPFAQSDVDSNSTDVERGVAVFRSAVEVCCENQLLPVHAQSFVAELSKRPTDRQILSWAIDQLAGMRHRQPELTWDDRMGIMAVSFGIELPIYYGITWTVALCVVLFSGLSLLWQLAAVGLPALFLPCVIGFVFRGGPVFSFTGVRVVQRGGHRAGRLRCAWRNFLSWMCVMAAYSANSVWFVSVSLPSLASDSVIGNTLLQAGWFVLMLPHLAGALYSVARPKRGLQDLFAGTFLVPR